MMDVEAIKRAVESRPWKDSYLRLRHEYLFVAGQSRQLQAEWSQLQAALQRAEEERDALIDLCTGDDQISVEVPSELLQNTLSMPQVPELKALEKIPTHVPTAAELNAQAIETHRRI